eukprot:766298-Hanusia_phi.AAC.1
MSKPASPLKYITLYTMPERTFSYERKTETLSPHVREALHISDTLIAVVDAEPPMLQWLCSEKSFHRILVGDTLTWQKRNEIAHKAEFREEDPRTRKFRHAVAGDGVYTPSGYFRVSYSIHGSRNMLFTSNDVRPSRRIIVGDDSDSERLKEKVEEGRKKVAELEDDVSANQLREDDARATLNAAGNELKKTKDLILQYDSKALDNQIREIEKLIKLERDKKPLHGKEELEAELKNVLQRRKELCKTVAEAVKDCTDMHVEQVAAMLEAEPLRRKVAKAEQEEGVIKSQFNEVKEEFDQEFEETKRLKARVEGLEREMPQISQEDKEAFGQLENDEEQLESSRTQLREDLTKLGVQQDRQAEYDAVKSKIEKLRSDLRNFESEMDEKKKLVEKKKVTSALLSSSCLTRAEQKLWLDGGERGDPNRRVGLREMVERINDCFSDSFERMGNVGEVKLNEAKNQWDEDDFANYSISIMVKFREEQELLPLDGRVQSGGETSLSTMLFLLSLQQITRCPFRVVDEINQGMDIHYEKVSPPSSSPCLPFWLLSAPCPVLSSSHIAPILVPLVGADGRAGGVREDRGVELPGGHVPVLPHHPEAAGEPARQREGPHLRPVRVQGERSAH